MVAYRARRWLHVGSDRNASSKQNIRHVMMALAATAALPGLLMLADGSIATAQNSKGVAVSPVVGPVATAVASEVDLPEALDIATATRTASLSPQAPLPSRSRRIGAANDKRSVGSLLINIERVKIRFHSHPTFSGEYSISGDNTISLPIIGRFDVGGLTLTGLEEMLAQEYLRATGRDVYPTVDVVSYRNVVVTGFVNQPGAHPWQRGMTVLHLEALAGGRFRPTSVAGGGLVADVERTKARRAAADVARLRVQLARLNAERNGSKTLKLPAGLEQIVSESEVRSIVTAEQSVLASRRATYEAQIQSLSVVSTTSASELELQREQLKKSAQLLAARRSKLNKLRQLSGRRVITEQRYLEEEAAIAAIEERLLAQTLTLQRLDTSRRTADRDLEVVKRKYQAEVDSQAQETERVLAQLEIELDGASTSYQSLAGRNALTQRPTQSGSLSYRIIRKVDGKPRSFKAGRDVELIPGDVLLIDNNGAQ